MQSDIFLISEFTLDVSTETAVAHYIKVQPTVVFQPFHHLYEGAYALLRLETACEEYVYA